jgi:hypothetical protein
MRYCARCEAEIAAARATQPPPRPLSPEARAAIHAEVCAILRHALVRLFDDYLPPPPPGAEPR